ncbi:exocyst complex component Sec5-domain-containing protein [Scheffersomyces xylosifermentans]|uniref:exocyst complex component Sec5-domain-containing protein n=1 Tax=Scheffersomyces xylosifermentans TaxID=1304137 RepID=UPI00315D083C
MLNYDYTEADLLSFYNIQSLDPTSKQQLNLSTQEDIDPIEIAKLSKDEQFNILNDLLNPNRKSDFTESYNVHTEQEMEDPLRGRGSNVARNLVGQKIVTSIHDPELNSYLIGSQNFNSQKFLTTVHKDTPIEELTASLGYLEQSIQSQTSELKGVIDANFIKFVNCKKAIDNVLVEFKNSKTKAQQDKENATVFNPQRHRNVIKQETLSSELEEALKNLNMTTALMIRPIQDNKNRETKLNKLIEFVKSHQFFFDLPSNLVRYLSTHNHDSFINDYNKFLVEKQEFSSVQRARYNSELTRLTKEKNEEAIRALDQEQQLINTALAKVYDEVDRITDKYRSKTYKELLSLDHEAPSNGRGRGGTSSAKFTALVDKLYQLDSNKNLNANKPIYEFLSASLAGVNSELDHQIAKYDNKFRMMQRKLKDYISSLADTRKDGSHIRYIGEKYTSTKTDLMVSKPAKTPEEKNKIVLDVFDSSDNLDLSLINETWLVLHNFVHYLEGLFSKNLTKFVNNYKHYAQFNVDPKGVIRDEFVNIINKVSLVLVTLFENESSSEANQLESTPKDYQLFLPHYTNSLSTVFYLSNVNQMLNKLFTTLGDLSGNMGNVSKYADTNKVLKNLKSASAKTNQKIIEAVCSVWVNDCSQFYELEDWSLSTVEIDSRENDGSTYTKLMDVIDYYQTYILIKLAALTISKDDSNSDFRIVSAYPSKRMLMSIEIQFMRSLNIIVDSVMKKYTIERKKDEDIIANDNATFKVLSMNNFDKLSRITYPKLIKKFDELFAKDLSSQRLKLFADIDKASLTIFDDISSREKLWIGIQVAKFFNDSKTEAKAIKLRVDGFIYEILIHFVRLINKVKPITGKEIFITIINDLQSSLLKSILDNLRSSDSFSALALVNLKMDVNFFMEVFENSKTLKFSDATFKLLEVLLNTIEEKYNSSRDKFDYSKADFDSIMYQNLKDSENEFDCF